MKRIVSDLYVSILFFAVFTACQASEEQETNEEKEFVLLQIYEGSMYYQGYFFIDRKISNELLNEKIKEMNILLGEHEKTSSGKYLEPSFFFVESQKNTFQGEVDKQDLASLNNLNEATLFTKEELEDVLKKIKYNREEELKEPYSKLKRLHFGECMKWWKENKKAKMILIKEGEKVKAYSRGEFLNEWPIEQVIVGIFIIFSIITLGLLFVSKSKNQKREAKKVKAEF